MIKFHEEPFRTPEERLAASRLEREDRQNLIETMLYKYPVFKTGEAHVRNVHLPVDGGTHGKGVIAGLLGDTRMGKSTICTYYAKQFPSYETEDGEFYPIVIITATDEMTPTHFAERLYWETGTRSVPKLKTPMLIAHGLARLVLARSQLVIIDDAQFLIQDRSKPHVQAFKSLLKQLADLRTLNVLLVGEPMLQDFVEATPYLHSRGFPHKTLVPMSRTTEGEEDFAHLMGRIDARLPFADLSGLDRKDIAADFHKFSDGMIGRVMSLVKFSSFMAFNEQTSRIMGHHLRTWANLLRRKNDDFEYFKAA